MVGSSEGTGTLLKESDDVARGSSSTGSAGTGPREVTAEDEELLDRIAKLSTVRWGMTVPAIFTSGVVEAAESFIGEAVPAFPVSDRSFGGLNAQDLDRLAMSARTPGDTVENLIQRIERGGRRRWQERGFEDNDGSHKV